MLAAFGWPVSGVINFGKLLAGGNGGLCDFNLVYLVEQKDYLLGMRGFDPLGADSPMMRKAEITTRRLAMAMVAHHLYYCRGSYQGPEVAEKVSWTSIFQSSDQNQVSLHKEWFLSCKRRMGALN